MVARVRVTAVCANVYFNRMRPLLDDAPASAAAHAVSATTDVKVHPIVVLLVVVLGKANHTRVVALAAVNVYTPVSTAPVVTMHAHVVVVVNHKHRVIKPLGEGKTAVGEPSVLAAVFVVEMASPHSCAAHLGRTVEELVLLNALGGTSRRSNVRMGLVHLVRARLDRVVDLLTRGRNGGVDGVHDLGHLVTDKLLNRHLQVDDIALVGHNRCREAGRDIGELLAR